MQKYNSSKKIQNFSFEKIGTFCYLLGQHLIIERFFIGIYSMKSCFFYFVEKVFTHIIYSVFFVYKTIKLTYDVNKD